MVPKWPLNVWNPPSRPWFLGVPYLCLGVRSAVLPWWEKPSSLQSLIELYIVVTEYHQYTNRIVTHMAYVYRGPSAKTTETNKIILWYSVCVWFFVYPNFFLCWSKLVVSINEDTCIAEWFSSWKILSNIAWWLGIPPWLGNHHKSLTCIINYQYWLALIPSLIVTNYH